MSTHTKVLTCLPNSINKWDSRPHVDQAKADLPLATLAQGLKIVYRALTPVIDILGFLVSLPLQALLSEVHPPEDKTAMDLGCGERQMQDGRDNLEGKPPPVPRACKQPHRNNSLGDCPQCGRETGEEEDLAEELVPIGEDSIQNNSGVGE